MVRLRCPKCKTIIAADSIEAAVCPGCGFSAGTAAGLPPPPPPPTPPVDEPAPEPEPSAPAPAAMGWTPATEWTPAPPASAWPTPTPAPKARGWVMPVFWALTVVYLLVEGLLFSLLAEPEVWEAEGLKPSTTSIAVLVVLDLGLRTGIGVLVARDMKAIGAQRLKLAQVPATSLERTSPVGWGFMAGIFVLISVIILSAWRRRIVALAHDAASAPTFADRKQVAAAMKKPGVFREADVKAMGRRNTAQWLVFIVLFVLMGALNRL